MANTTPKHLWENSSGIVDADSMSTIESLSIEHFSGLKLILTAFNNSNDKRKIKEYNISKITNDVKFTCFGVVGDNLAFKVKFEVLSGNLEISVENNESFGLNVELAFIRLGIF